MYFPERATNETLKVQLLNAKKESVAKVILAKMFHIAYVSRFLSL